jgi:phage tail-like protein
MPPPGLPTGGRPPDPVIQARYKVDFPKLSGVFTKISVSSASVSAVQYQYTGADGQPNSSFQPGLRTLPTVTLERGMTSDLSAWTWHQEVLQGKISTARVNGTISILDNEGKPAASFNIMNAWPTKVDMPPLMASGGAIGTEVIQLTCEGFERAS